MEVVSSPYTVHGDSAWCCVGLCIKVRLDGSRLQSLYCIRRQCMVLCWSVYEGEIGRKQTTVLILYRPIPCHVCYSLDSIFRKQLRKLSILNDIHILVYYLQ